jgi:hypothetical protein
VRAWRPTIKGHGGHTPAGVRVLQRLLAHTAAIWHNDQNGQPVKRSLGRLRPLTPWNRSPSPARSAYLKNEAGSWASKVGAESRGCGLQRGRACCSVASFQRSGGSADAQGSAGLAVPSKASWKVSSVVVSRGLGRVQNQKQRTVSHPVTLDRLVPGRQLRRTSLSAQNWPICTRLDAIHD